MLYMCTFEGRTRMRKMKDSGIEWIGDIPEGWEVRKIKTFSPVLRGASPRPIDDPQYFDENGKYSWVRISDVSAAKKYLYSAGDKLSKIGESKSVKIHAGDLFVSICASVGKACISEIDCCIHDGFVYFPSLDKRMVNFLYYIFTSGECYSGLGKLGTQLNLNTNTVSDIYIPFLSIEHCVCIADYLDAKCARIDESMELVRQSMEKLRAYKLSLITEAVTKGLDPDVPMKDSGIPWIGEVPEGWEVMRLKHTLSSPLQYGANASGISYDSTLPRYIRITDIDENGCLKDENMQSLPEDEALGYILDDGDILLARSGATVGKSFLYKKELGRAAFAGYLIRAKMDISILLYYYFYYITQSQMYRGWKDYIFVQATIQNIGAEKYSNLYIPLPPLSEQQRIADYLDAKCARIDALLEEKERLLDRLAEYKKSLIFECVTGKREVSA